MATRRFPRKFFKRVFSHTLEDYKFDAEVRCIHQSQDKDSLRPLQFWCNSLEELESHWPEIQDANRRGYDVHFTVVPRLRKYQGKKEHPLPDKPIFSCFWADIDVGEGKPHKTITDALERVRTTKPTPSVIVESGTGLHAYYRLNSAKGIARERAEALLRAAADRLDGDHGAARATRLMRAPGTINWKNGERNLVKPWYFTKKKYSLKTLRALWKPKAEDKRSNGDYFDLFSPHVERLTRNGQWARGLCPFHDDHKPSFSVNLHTGWWVCFGCGREGSWTQFRKQKDIPIGDGGMNRQEPTETFGWNSLPRFDPTKAPDTKWLVEGLIPERAITMIVGASGAFKSTLALFMANAITKGEEFLDRQTRKRRVLYLDNENPPDVLKTRNENMKLEMESNKKLRLWSTYDDRPVPKILSGELRQIVKESVAERRKLLIIFDHWSSFLRPGEGGETTGQITPLMQELKHLCTLGATVVVLHHTKKYDPDIEYGGGDLKAKSDAMHTFVLHEDKLHPNAEIIRIKCFLKRHGGSYAFALRPRIAKGQVTGFEVVEDPVEVGRRQKREKLWQLIRKNPGLPKHALVRKAQEQGFSRDEAREILRKGVGRLWEIKTGPHGTQNYRLLED